MIHLEFELFGRCSCQLELWNSRDFNAGDLAFGENDEGAAVEIVHNVVEEEEGRHPILLVLRLLSLGHGTQSPLFLSI